MSRPDFVNTSPFFIRESRPADLPDLEPLSCKPWPLPAIFGPAGPVYYRPTPAPTWRERLRRFLSHAWHG